MANLTFAFQFSSMREGKELPFVKVTNHMPVPNIDPMHPNEAIVSNSTAPTTNVTLADCARDNL